ncbi:MAG: M18 family aminopeptidase, partial [Planctomycetes bacterium]|nr:M18 family aminopeptidase [Planctomycetota bacterium]
MGVIRSLLDFIHDSPTPYHAVSTTIGRLSEGHFQRLDEGETWALEAGGRYWVSRGDSSIIAFVVGSAGLDDEAFSIVGAHTDSPNLRVKPNGDFLAHGYR